jgi:hypothetical protein
MPDFRFSPKICDDWRVPARDENTNELSSFLLTGLSQGRVAGAAAFGPALAGA